MPERRLKETSSLPTVNGFRELGRLEDAPASRALFVRDRGRHAVALQLGLVSGLIAHRVTLRRKLERALFAARYDRVCVARAPLAADFDIELEHEAVVAGRHGRPPAPAGFPRRSSQRWRDSGGCRADPATLDLAASDAGCRPSWETSFPCARGRGGECVPSLRARAAFPVRSDRAGARMRLRRFFST